MPRGGGTSSRGRGKFKVTRGGGRQFSRDLDPRRAVQPESESEESEEETSSDDDEPSRSGPAVTLAPEMAAMNLKLGNTVPVESQESEISRAERKAMKKAQAEKEKAKELEEDSDEEDDDDDDLLNPKMAAPKKQAVPQAKAKPKAPVVAEMTRREREEAEKKAAAERYQKLHAQGKTVEAKSDLARLQEVRRRREAAAAQRQAEADEAAREAAEKKEKAAARRI